MQILPDKRNFSQIIISGQLDNRKKEQDKHNNSKKIVK